MDGDRVVVASFRILLSCLWLGAAPCSLGCGSASASTSAENDAVQVVERWATAFTEADVDAIVGTYAPDALFFGTGSQTLVRKPEDTQLLRHCFEPGQAPRCRVARALGARGLRTKWSWSRVWIA